jgi:hypothetical protein
MHPACNNLSRDLHEAFDDSAARSTLVSALERLLASRQPPG